MHNQNQHFLEFIPCVQTNYMKYFPDTSLPMAGGQGFIISYKPICVLLQVSD